MNSNPPTLYSPFVKMTRSEIGYNTLITHSREAKYLGYLTGDSLRNPISKVKGNNSTLVST